MQLRNNNREIISALAKSSYKYSKSRNRLMIGAVAVAVIIVFCVFSIMKGRIDAEYLSEVRHEGSNASTILDYPTKEQTEKIKNLNYIDEVGVVNNFAKGRGNGRDAFVCVVADKVAFEDMYIPAYSDIHGSYPKKDDEIMLSIRGLEELGIKNPKLGMDIDIEVYMDKNKSDFQTFKLSGYYTEYVNPIWPSIGFFTEGYQEKLGYSMNEPSKLLIRQKSWYSWEEVEERLYKDIETTDEVQKFTSENSVNYNVIMRTTGGYGIAIIAIALILFCVFLLNYNVMSISIAKDIRHYGLLKTIGATNKQIRKILYKQTLRIGCFGVTLGVGVSAVVIKILLPKVLSKYYLDNYGVSSNIVKFNWIFMLITIIIAFIILFISVIGPARKASKISPIESTKFVNVKVTNQKRKNKNFKGDEIKNMAWRNVIRNKKSLIFTITSLFVGLTIGLISILTTSALDYTNNFKLFPDFEMSSGYSPLNDNYDKHYMAITNEDIEYFKNIDGVKEVDVIYVDYAKLNSSESVWNPSIKSKRLSPEKSEDDKERLEEIKNDYYATIVIVDDNYLNKLENYVKKNNINIDIEGLKNGTSAICSEGEELSKKLLESSKSLIGEKFTIENIDGSNTVEMNFGGYVDTRPEGFPEKHFGYKIQNGNELFVSEKAIDKLRVLKKPGRINIYVEEEKEPRVEKKLKIFEGKLKEKIGISEWEEKGFFMHVKSESLEAAQDEIKTMKIVMYTVSGLLIMLGLVNYLNTVVTNILSRRQEIATLESIGITRKQLRKLLTTEGLYYSLIVSILLVTVGTGIIILAFKVLKSNVGYAKFIFPYIPMGIVIVILFAICVIVPLILYKQIDKESVIERLRLSGE
ncbi:ABC transporter permease [Miniphocaeibacter massiliensis]|uniref:ABC transporter permease n=1 Tax=Miniphocaeibacter massiliensis TaxID=2041841 RepID=UPI000C1BF6DF|nr:FtsX-like permease family protein [Miniphocaeibacter massiliensis]